MKKIYMKIIFVFFLFTLCESLKSSAQVSFYSFTSTAGTYDTLTNPINIHTGVWDDALSPSITLPFTFNYNNVNYTQVRVNTNGTIYFGATTTNSTNYNAISSALASNTGSFSGLARDLQGNQTGQYPIAYQVLGNSPNQQFVVQWEKCRAFVGTQTWSFQMILNETSNTLQVIYGDFTTPNASTAQVGLRGATTADFNNRQTLVSWASSTPGVSNFNTVSIGVSNNPTSGLIYTWTPPPPCTGTPSAGTITSPTGACSGTPFSISATGYTNNASLLAFSWQSDVGCTGAWSNVVGQTFPNSGIFTQTSSTCYRLHVSCTISGLEAVSNSVNVGMNAAINCYPLWIASSAADEELYNTTITGVTSLNQSSTCGTLAPGVGSIMGRYSNYRGYSTVPDLMQANYVSFSLTQQTCGGAFTNGFKIWIDYNQDGDFADAGEGVYSQPVAATGNHTKTGSFLVPFNALPGITGLRVCVVEGAFPNTFPYGATQGFTWGETEDYYCNIVPLVPCSGMPSAGNISQTTSSVADTTTVFTLSTVLPPTIAGGIIYQWQINDGNGWMNLGATINNPLLTATSPNADTTNVTGQTFPAQYRLTVTCTNTSQTDSSSAVSVASGQVSACTSTITYTYTGASNGVQFDANTIGTTANYQWDFGDGSSSNLQNPQHNYAATGAFNVCVIITDTTFLCADTSCMAVLIQAQSEISGTVYHDSNNNNMIDIGESGFSSIAVSVNGNMFNTITDSAGYYSLYLPAGNYFVQTTSPLYYFQTVPMNSGGYSVALNINDTVSGFDFALATNIAFLSGNVYYDINQNGVKDSTEIGLFNQTVSLDNANWNFVLTDSLGNYSVVVPPGIHDLSFEGNYYQQVGWVVTSPVGNNISVNADSLGFEYSDNDFGIYFDSMYNDIGVDLICMGFIPNPGFSSNVYINYTNYGFITDSIKLTFHYDSLLSYDYSNWSMVQPDVVDTVNNLIYYFLEAIPGNSDYLDLAFIVPVGTPLGTPIHNSVTLSSLVAGPDYNLTNDTSFCQTTVVGSFDPNDKHVNPAGVGPLHAVPPTQTTDLTYTVNFQNTGTAPAVNVVVVDTLDNNAFVVSSFYMINTSHPATVELVEGRILRVHFNNIMLADSFNNEPESHGFFTFKIHLQDNLPLGTIILNRAAIYFDFNVPVITNTAFVTLMDIESGIPIELSSNFSYYPNPVHDQFFVDLNKNEKCSGKFRLTNTLGQIEIEENFIDKNSLVLDVEKLSSGIYFLSVQTASGISTVKLVKD